MHTRSSPKTKKNQSLLLWKGEHFNALAALLNAGTAPAEAITLLRKQYTYLSPELTHMVSRLKAGQSLRQAFSATRLLRAIDLEILFTAEQAGKTVDAIKFIGKRFDSRASRLKKIKSQFILPTLIFILAIIIGFVIQMVNQTASAGAISLQSALYILGFTITMKAIFASVNWDSITWMKLLSRIGVFSGFSLAQRCFEYTWLTVFLWQHTSGIDWIKATERISNLVPTSNFQQKIRASTIALQQGQSLSKALTISGVSISQTAMLTLRTGENSGNMEQSLQPYLTLEAERLDDAIQRLTDWLPRLCYAFIVLFVISYVIPRPNF